MELINSDCLIAMTLMEENSVDSIVTDPPYELGFMGKSWDSTGIANSIEMWSQALRVLKPGGHLIAFSGSRTYHRMAVAIEDAGFEIRDQIMWIYGSGFPKSHDVSQGIDKQAGAEREIVGSRITGATMSGKTSGIENGQGGTDFGSGQNEIPITAPATAEAKQWQGWGTALKPAHEPMVLARKPLIGTVAANVLTYGTGGLNIDGARVGSEGGKRKELSTEKSTTTSVGGYLNQKAGTPINAGRWPANVIHDGSDEVVELFPDTGKSTPSKGHFRNGNTVGDERTSTGAGLYGDGAWIAGSQHNDSGSAARFFYCAKASKRDRNEGLDGFEEIQLTGGGGLTAELREDGSLETASAGGKYGAIKAKKANHHPTVKPTELMRYLVRMITPPKGTVLDPFMGSGSTGKACAYEGFDFIGIDQSAEYVEIAKARIEFASKQGEDKDYELPF